VGAIITGLTANSTEDNDGKIPLPPVKLKDEAYQLLKTGQWEEAIGKLEDAYRMTMSDPNLKYYLAFCHDQLAHHALNEKRYEDAVSQLENAVHYVDDIPRLHLELGFCYFSLSQYDEAEEALDKVIQLKPEHFMGNRLLGDVYYLTNRMDDAETHWQTALKSKPDDDYVKKKLAGLIKYRKASKNFETEFDNMFTVSFDGEKKPKLRDLVSKMLGEISIEIGQELDLYSKRQIPVILLTNQEFFDVTGSPEWAGGVYEGHIKVPVDKYDSRLLRIVLAHEYVHAVIYDRLSYRCPWWLNEGLAQYMSGDTDGNNKKLELASRFITKAKGSVPRLEKLPGNLLKKGDGNQVILAYSLALSAVKYFMEQFGHSDMKYALELMAGGRGFDSVVKELYGYSFAEFQQNWQEDSAR
jgi:tetratricopeptide (TPR) repeat protein